MHFRLAKKWRISRLEIFEAKLTKDHQKVILLVFSINNYGYYSVVYVGLASFEPKRHQIVEFQEGNICTFYLGVFEQQNRLLVDHKSSFSDVYEAYLCYLEEKFNFQLVIIGLLMSCNSEEDFFRIKTY